MKNRNLIKHLCVFVIACTVSVSQTKGATTEELVPPAPTAGPAPTAQPKPAAEEPDEFEKLAQMLSQSRDESIVEFFYNCKYVRSQTLVDVLTVFKTSQGKIAQSSEADMIIIADVPSNLARLKKIIDKVDQWTPQILVQAQIVELSKDYDFEKELENIFTHTNPDGTSFVNSISSTLETPGTSSSSDGIGISLTPWIQSYGGGKSSELTSYLRLLESKGKARILSAPNLVLRRDVEGSITTGEDIPIQEQTVVSGSLTTSVEYRSVGVILKVTPTRIFGDTVRLLIEPEVSAVSGYATTEDGLSNPEISVRSASTVLDVRDGELVSLGGLYKSTDSENIREVPVLSKIPGIGNLFRSRRVLNEKTQLVFLFRVDILGRGEPGGKSIHYPQGLQEDVRAEVYEQEKRLLIPEITRRGFTKDENGERLGSAVFEGPETIESLKARLKILEERKARDAAQFKEEQDALRKLHGAPAGENLPAPAPVPSPPAAPATIPVSQPAAADQQGIHEDSSVIADSYTDLMKAVPLKELVKEESSQEKTTEVKQEKTLPQVFE